MYENKSVQRLGSSSQKLLDVAVRSDGAAVIPHCSRRGMVAVLAMPFSPSFPIPPNVGAEGDSRRSRCVVAATAQTKPDMFRPP